MIFKQKASLNNKKARRAQPNGTIMASKRGSTKTRNPESGNGNGITETETETETDTESVKEGSKRSI